jgi:hypothetical protein
MAKAKKVVTKDTEIPDEVKTQLGFINPVSIPDIPAQMETITEHSETKEDETLIESVEVIPETVVEAIPVKEVVTSIPQEPKGETEIEFLYRILSIQENGGFGRHLDKIIYDRIKSLS